MTQVMVSHGVSPLITVSGTMSLNPDVDVIGKKKSNDKTLKKLSCFCKKMGQTRHLFVYFYSFLKTNRYSTNLTLMIMIMRRWYAWDSNPGQQDGRRRRIH